MHAGSAASSTAGPAGATGLAPRQLLLVEDNEGDALLACDRLTESQLHPFEVMQTQTLAQAVEVLRKRRVDAVILDLNLPDSRGMDTIREVRQVAHAAPIIAVSGVVDARLRERAQLEGAEDLFEKQETDSRLFWRSVTQIIERRRTQQRQFQSLLDATPDAILLVNRRGIVRYVNDAALKLFGQSREVLLNEPLAFSVSGDGPTEITILRHGEARTCEMRVVDMDWDDEHASLASIRDVTDRKRAEELQAQSQALQLENQRMGTALRMRNQFMANMSHELRTPLNAIIGFSQLLQAGLVEPGSPKFQVFVGHILSSGEHLLRMINDLLDLAKIEAGRLSFRPEPVDLRALIESVMASLAGVAAPDRHHLQLEMEPDLGPIVIDPSRFKQVLYNYLSNALKFSPPGGEVKVRVQAEGPHHFRLSVRDQGPGIAPKDLGRLFTEFEQLDGSAAKRHQGTGLGLALTKHLVQVQGGKVGVTSTLGEGSEFHAVLPRTAVSTTGD